MKYRGRIGALLFAILACFYWEMNHDDSQFYQGAHLLSLFFFSVMAWWAGNYHDDRRNLNEKLKEEKDELQSILDHVDAAAWSFNYENHRFSLSKGIEKITGTPLQKLYVEGMNWQNRIYNDDRMRALTFFRNMNDGTGGTAEFRIVDKQQIKWVEMKLSPIKNEQGKVIKTVGIMADITERKKAEEQVKTLAYIDSLTKMPNRTSLFTDLRERIQTKQETSLVMIDLDRFKAINDSFGHQAGDILLHQVANRLRITSMGANCRVYRYGSDEFWLMCHHSNEQKLIKIAEKIIQAFSIPFNVESHEVCLTPSIGISTYPNDAADADALFIYADSAMYMAKEKGGNNYQFFNSDLYHKIQRKTGLEKELRQAIEKNELFLQYQPQVELQTNQIIGFEALIRWQNEKLGLVSPAEFIPVAEETGLISKMGEWVLKEACLQSKAWQKQGLGKHKMSVNISVKQFQKNDFIDTFHAIINETNMEPSLLQVEITESIMQNTHETKQILDELKRIGVEVSIDDFGTGYSSLSVLKELPLDCLKIDQSFIRDLTTSKKETAIVKNIIDLAHNLELNVVAEGVEHAGQFKMLQQLGCQIGQGYLFSKPLDEKEAEMLLLNENQKNVNAYKINA